MSEKIRTIITQDAEVDDQNSLRHFLLYANEVELQGIVQTSSIFHWIGVPGATQPHGSHGDEWTAEEAPYDKPYRWTGTAWMGKAIDDYAAVYENLKTYSSDYPTPDYLRSITKVGNIGYAGETERATEGSELIRKRILDDDPRTLYIQVWGGTNTIARALMDIEAEFGGDASWPALREKIEKKVVITACGEQDGTYRSYIAEKFPGLQFVRCLQMGSYAYPWRQMPEGESKESLKAAFMENNIIHQGSLMAGYATWLDGKVYEGEGDPGQFGSNPDIMKVWFGAKMGLPPYEKHDFLSEGDSPTFFCLLPFGYRTLENFANGGIAGRYVLDESQKNSKGEALNYWNVADEPYTDSFGKTSVVESMWPHVADLQHGFAARARWCTEKASVKSELPPVIEAETPLDISAKAGETVTIAASGHTQTAAPGTSTHTKTGKALPVTYSVYGPASTLEGAADLPLTIEGGKATLTLPAAAKAGNTVHVIARTEEDGPMKLPRFAQFIITIK